MITKDQAMTANEFVSLVSKNKKGEPHKVRRSGKTQIWKTRPDEFKIPVKFGLYQSLYITHLNAHEFAVTE